jgi:hypothetical protein
MNKTTSMCMGRVNINKRPGTELNLISTSYDIFVIQLSHPSSSMEKGYLKNGKY